MADKSVEECVPKNESNVSEVTPETQYNDNAIVESANSTVEKLTTLTELKELKEELSKVDNNINEIQSALEELDELESKNVEQADAEKEETEVMKQEEEEEEEEEEDKLPHLQIVIKQQQEVPGLITYTFTLLMIMYAFKAFVLLCDYMNSCGKNCICLSS